MNSNKIRTMHQIMIMLPLTVHCLCRLGISVFSHVLRSPVLRAEIPQKQGRLTQPVLVKRMHNAYSVVVQQHETNMYMRLHMLCVVS